MKCPICQTETDLDKCPTCGFPYITKTFSSAEEAELWNETTLYPCREMWKTYQERCADNLSEYEIEEDVLVKYIGSSRRIMIPSFIRSIKANAFSRCKELEELIIPQGVEVIGDGAFYGCEKLSSVRLPESISYIGDRAFGHTYIEEITIPGDVHLSRYGAFSDCPRLNHIYVSTPGRYRNIDGYEGVYIDDMLVLYPPAQSTVVIPDEIKYIDRHAVESRKECTVILGQQVEGCAPGAFRGNIKFHVHPLNRVYSSDAATGALLSKDGRTIYAFLNRAVISNARTFEQLLPDKVICVGQGANISTINLGTHIRIPNRLVRIEENGIALNYECKTVTIPPSVETVAANAFSGGSVTEVFYSKGTELHPKAFGYYSDRIKFVEK